jgi:hypothetical protein
LISYGSAFYKFTKRNNFAKKMHTKFSEIKFTFFSCFAKEKFIFREYSKSIVVYWPKHEIFNDSRGLSGHQVWNCANIYFCLFQSRFFVRNFEIFTFLNYNKPFSHCNLFQDSFSLLPVIFGYQYLWLVHITKKSPFLPLYIIWASKLSDHYSVIRLMTLSKTLQFSIFDNYLQFKIYFQKNAP